MFAVAPPPADCCVSTVSTPHAAPLQPLPDSDHVTACAGFDPATGVSIAVIVAEPLTGTLAGADICTVKLLVIVIVADAFCEGSATLCAVSVAVAEDGKTCGAVKLPLASTAPHADGHASPLSDQRTAASGCPALEIEARKFRVAPSSTAALLADNVNCTSLAIVTFALAVFVVSAWLVAVTCGAGFTGKSGGAVYTPAEVIVPRAALPPGTPLTLHVTVVSSEFFTVAAKVCEFPSRTVALVGVTLTLTSVAGGSGVGGGVEGGRKDSPRPAHPSASRPAVRARRSD